MASEVVRYASEGEQLVGYLALPEGAGPHPAVIVVHEWWGLKDYIRERADMLAGLGYAGFAVDMYGEGRTADDPERAAELMNSAFPEAARRFQAAMDALGGRADIANGKLAAMGYCFGGAVVLAMARAGVALAGVASFHGILETDSPAQPGAVRAKVRVFHGNDDAMVSPASAAAFREEMEAAGVDYEFVGYEGAGHGFTSPRADENHRKFGLPVAYDKAADEDSWRRLRGFLQSLFG